MTTDIDLTELSLASDPPTAEIPVVTNRGAHAALGPRAIKSRTVDDNLSLIGSAAGSFGLVWLVYHQILPANGSVGFLVCWYLAFIALYATVTALNHSGPAVRDRIATAVIQAGAALVGLALASVIIFTFARGMPALVHPNTFTQDGGGIGPLTPITRGGALHAVVGSLIEMSLAVSVALPLGIGTAVYMTEVGGRMSRVVRTVVEAMTALPSIVAGLFIYTVLLLNLGFQRTGLCAAAAIAVMILPIIARASDVVLRVVPNGLREASLALGASRWQTVRRVVLPTARPGLATALILGIARGIGETSPVLLTSGASTFMNTNPLTNPMNSLPLYIYSTVRSGQNVLVDRAFGAASILLGIVLILFVTARRLARQKPGRG